MSDLRTVINNLQKQAEEQLNSISSLEECHIFRTKFLGKKGSIPSLNDSIKNCTLEIKRELGPIVQALRFNLEEALNKKVNLFEKIANNTTVESHRFFDVSLEKKQVDKGSLHVLTLVTHELEEIFISMGFSLCKGPEIETNFYNFEALNIPHNHPARDAHDTFWLSGYADLLLRTHTSNAQIHTMQAQKPPLAIASTGRVFRNEATDASHDFMFMQIEALLVDKNVSLAHLSHTIQTMLRIFFNKETLTIRMRPGYFPFVEPGLEVDGSCPFCTEGCSMCKYTRWIELGGAGLVHPKVLQACNIDHTVYNGFALGFGISRLALLKYNIPDVRFLYTPKIEFLSQFHTLNT
ncbi:MAG TPA: phenylalanine--tRNA ligase subunit alpha [Patescibacteria group bacterium]|jgi:phenylalanyl-tRNA synthetase alpha chain|nr:phenylalanine--tRNA ligase subunit alpha [Patescibacteria group bacterium]